MGTVHHTQVLFETAADTGIRYTGGKAMMDAGDMFLAGGRPTGDALRESDQLRLLARYRGRAPSLCLLAALRPHQHDRPASQRRGAGARSNDLLVHTHASEQKAETERSASASAPPTSRPLANLGLCDGNVCLAHCVWPEDHQLDTLASGGAHVVHCPAT